jgi:hypothetical protein
MDPSTERCPWCNSFISRDQFIEVEARIRAEEKKRLADAEAVMRRRLELEKQEAEQKTRDDAAKQVASIAAERDSVLQKVQVLEAREAAIRQQARDEATLQARAAFEQLQLDKQNELAEQRAILETDRDQALLKTQAEFARERESWQKKIMEMDRQVQQKTANEIGEGAEVILHEKLKDAFPTDAITRIKKGQQGADIRQEIMYRGEVCGKILYDSKNRQDWKHAYVTKLREDQLEAHAEHGILTTTVFPSGQKELCMMSEIVVVNPARAIHIASILRRALIAMHVRGLSMKQRAEKTGRLYEFIVSRAYTQRFEQLAALTDEMLKLDVDEQKSHSSVWKKRGTLLTRQSNVMREIDTEISGIVEGGDRAASSAA